MSARQETIDRYRHFRAIAKQHLGGALKHRNHPLSTAGGSD